TMKPPLFGSAFAGRSMPSPDLLWKWTTKSCAICVEKTSGAPSTARTSGDFCAQETALGSTARRGGSCGASTAGQPTTRTDLGFLNDGGLLRRRFSESCLGRASAGMYWYSAEWRLAKMRATSMTAPTYGLYAPPPASGTVLTAPARSAEGPLVRAAT